MELLFLGSKCCTASSRQLPPRPLAVSLCCSRVAACPLPAHSALLLRHSSLPFARLQTLKAIKTIQIPRTTCHPSPFKRSKPLQPSNCCTASSRQLLPSPLAVNLAVPGLQPALCLHIPRGSFHQAPGRQRSSIAACPLPAHSPLLLGHSSLPFARLQTLKTLKTLKTLQLPRGSFHQALWPSAFAVPALQPALCLHIALCCWGIQASHWPAFKRLKPLKPSNLQTLKTLTTLQLLHCFLAAAATIQPSNAQNPYNPPTAALLPRGSCHQALWLSTFAVPGLPPALCLHIPRSSFHQAPGRQRSSIAACPLPAHSPLLLGHSSLPFARLQTLKTLKTLQLPRGSFHQALWPSAFAVPALQPALCLHIALCCWGIQASRLPAFKRLKPLKRSKSLAAAATKPSSHQRSSIAACPLPAHSLSC